AIADDVPLHQVDHPVGVANGVVGGIGPVTLAFRIVRTIGAATVAPAGPARSQPDDRPPASTTTRTFLATPPAPGSAAAARATAVDTAGPTTGTADGTAVIRIILVPALTGTGRRRWRGID